jgi:PST family polysaccharide transporter
MALRRQATLGFFWGLAERIAVQGGSFLVILVLARILGPADFGLVTLAATIVLFGQTLIGETFSDALIQIPTVDPLHRATVFTLLFSVAIFFILVLLASANLLAAWFAQPQLAPVVRALTPLFLITAVQAVPQVEFRRALNFRSLAIASSGGTVIGGITGIAMALSGYGVWSLVANVMVQNVTSCITLLVLSRSLPALGFRESHFREVWFFGRSTFLLRLVAFTSNQGPRILVGYLFGTAALGAFGLGVRLTDILIQFLSQPAANVVLPVVARLRKETGRLQNVITTATELSAMSAAPTFVFLAVSVPYLVPLVFGAKWQNSISIIQILSILGVCGATGLIWVNIIRGLGRPDISLRITAAGAATTIIFLLLFAPLGFHVASAVYVVRGYGTLIACPLILSRLTGLSAVRQYLAIGRILLAAMIMGAAVEAEFFLLGSTLSPRELLLTAVPLAALTYAGTLFLLAPRAIRNALAVSASIVGRRPEPVTP